ncbi:uncharacterized protein LOC129981694 [Argiope bruennichi]|uniref:Sushi domain-containing protein n=1 Tax=Argiope bruennichi TaxID=94029 RepID=A0A8T0E197_ARGBR|nr:uncharacterized protein LOC129981694 [Argiope bruennichi]KAF8764568.1 hypothetical protein HNY73_022631 [Argiope bruennichi]
MVGLQFICVLLTIISLLPCVMNATVERYQAELKNGIQEGEARFLSCMCDNNTDVSEPLDEEMATAIVTGELKLTHCRTFDARDICGLLLLCSECAIRHLNCYASEETQQLQCLNEIHLLNDNYFGLRERKLKDVVTIERTRVRRQAHVCTYPTNLKTADVACQTIGKKVTCTQACIFGHTLKGVVMKTMTCQKSENIWRPSGFTECEPFVDCSLSLKMPGTVDCFSGTTRTAPLCYVSCNQYEDQPAVPRRAYECTLSGTWNRPLPFCVATGSGLSLVPMPKNIVANPGYSK